MARRYLLNAVLEAIEDSPTFVASKEIKKAVNNNLKLNGWNRNLGTAHIGQLALLLVSERVIVARRRKGPEKIKEYLSINRIRSMTR